MSEIFEGVLFPSGLYAESAPSPTAPAPPLERRDLGTGVTAAYRTDSRNFASFTPEMDEVAASLSRSTGRALLVRFDSRVGHRSASLYERGRCLQQFGERDELFVPLDERGNPQLDASPLTLMDLDPASEYETAANAIQLGLAAFGHDSWAELFRLMTSSY